MKDLLTTFYTAFSQRDAEAMAACYHPDIVFEDPAFGQLKGKEASMMWRMLCQNGKDLEIQFSGIQADESTGKAQWQAWYTFSQTGRKVHNVVDAHFRFQDGKIIFHTDRFGLHRWARQALGLKGWLLGGTGFFRNGLQKQTKRTLQKFMAKQNS